LTQYIIAPEASQDLEEISAYYAIQNIEAGEKLINELENKCKYLVKFPKIGRSYGTIRTDLRGISCSGYIIFYRISENTIEILRVVFCSQKIDISIQPSPVISSVHPQC
jgi:toxin ParE1/3/4